LSRLLLLAPVDIKKRTATVAHYIVFAVLARRYGISEVEIRDIYLGAIVHDVGKIGVKDFILNKADKLTNEELLLMQLHPAIGKEILSKIEENISTAILIAYCHQERWDGKGYPLEIKGESIPLVSRIVSVADSYDAMTNDSTYRKPLSTIEAIDELKRCSGRQFDPEIVGVFIEYLEECKYNSD
jgi:HD-GYP domain-containing protein (c-di-GMP phosphodiesterase class II)